MLYYFARWVLMLLFLQTAVLPVSAQVPDNNTVKRKISYVVLENAPFPINHVQATCSGKGYIGVGLASLEIFNLVVPANFIQTLPKQFSAAGNTVFSENDSLLIAISVLPESTGKITWQPIALDTLSAAQSLSITALAQNGREQIEAYRKADNPKNRFLVNRNDLIPIVQRMGHYYAPQSPVLVEYFRIKSGSTKEFNKDYITINVKAPLLPQDKLRKKLQAKSPREASNYYSLALGLELGEVLHGVYEFWSVPEVDTSHPDPLYFGSGTFRYKPGIGLVSGKYGYYLTLTSPGLSALFFDKIEINGKPL